MKDLVISAIANYLPEKIKIYVESLNDSGFDGDKIMICYNIPNQTIEYLTTKGWECYGAELIGHPHMKRLIDMWWFLQNDERKWNHIITTDVRDIVWQLNPSNWLSDNLKSEIIVASECIKNEDEPWAHKNIHEGFGPMFWDSIKQNTVANVGVIAGKYQSVKDLLQLVWMVSQSGDTRHFTDQSALNLIVNNSLLKDKIEVNSDFAMQVDTLKSDKRFEKQHLTIKEGLVINTKDETPYVLVHQYDRIEQLNNLIENKYK
jgi:hypothetical protein